MATRFRTLISAAELKAQLGARELVLVDTRFSLADAGAGERAYAAGHLPGAFYAHLERDLSGAAVVGRTGRHPLPDTSALAERLRSWGLCADGQLVVYDDGSGAIAARLWWLARYLGHEAVAVLDGGYAAWSAAGLETTNAVPAAREGTGNFRERARPELLVDANAVEELRARQDHRLFDAREPPRFRGEVEPIDPVAGHIPGARCLPFSGNLHASKFLTRDALRERYASAFEGVTPERCVFYCGSGVTACHDILAATRAGFEGALLYPGSWSEWIADPKRPVARGDG